MDAQITTAGAGPHTVEFLDPLGRERLEHRRLVSGNALIWEEAGITCGDIRYFASQPWPFPMSMMIGCHAKALSTEITMDATELEGARWFDREEVALMLLRQHPDGLQTPPPMAIAHHIIRAWVEEGERVF